MKRVFGVFEAVFDAAYLAAALLLGVVLIAASHANPARLAAGVMAFVLAGGDAFHLLPRIRLIRTGNEEALRAALGRGKQITSITMTVFYVLLWHIGQLSFAPSGGAHGTLLIYLLAGARIALCLPAQNQWTQRYPAVRWSILRNIPFFLLGAAVAAFFFLYRSAVLGLGWMWLAILLSFAFYLPVVLWSNKKPKIGMLMLPKTCAYLWMLYMCLCL